MASRADPHVCYENSVQSPDVEVDFVTEQFKRLRGRTPALIREDFCGTAAVCCEWARRKPTKHVFGVDLDQPTLDWAREHNLVKLKPGMRERITLLNADVTKVRTPPVDLVVAMNFSYYLFKTREALRHYFSRVRAALKPRGIFCLDAYGGYEAMKVCRETTKIDRKLTYIWDQAAYNPINGDTTCHIHFRFSDGSSLRRAFTYEWRLWTLPEIRELLDEAGFRKTTVYWEGEDKNGEGDGDFKPATVAPADAGWAAYLSAER